VAARLRCSAFADKTATDKTSRPYYDHLTVAGTAEPINTDYIKIGLISPSVKKVLPATDTIGAFGFYQSSAGIKLQTLPARYMRKDCPICHRRAKWWLDEPAQKAICDKCLGVFTFHRRAHPEPTVP
jgi:hypothetical protein